MSKFRDKIQYIYKTTNLINGKIYIGRHSANNINNSYLGSGTKFRNAVKKYGKNNFSKEILEICLPCNYHIAIRERYYIKLYNSTNIDIGYNLTSGGEGELGITLSEETKRKISENHADVSGKNNPMYGKSFSMEHRKNISNSKKNYHKNNKSKLTKELLQFSVSGEFIKKWDSISEAETALNASGIKQYLCSNYRSNCVGYIWIKRDDYDNDSKILEEKLDTYKKITSLKKCKYCDFTGRLMDVRKHHDENCKKNPNKVYIICPVCGFNGNYIHMMERYHFNNCKYKNQ